MFFEKHPVDDNDLSALRGDICNLLHTDEGEFLKHMTADAVVDASFRERSVALAMKLIEEVRSAKRLGLMETFLAEYGLSNEEGVVLMRVAEALLRIPDNETVVALIEDKIGGGNWLTHMGKSESGFVNASTLGLALAGGVVDRDSERTALGPLRDVARRLGAPIVREAVKSAMRALGGQFILGRTISEALQRSRQNVQQGFSYSYDMLGEAAMSAADACRYFEAYRNAILAISKTAQHNDPCLNPGVSIKLSALHPRYERLKKIRVLEELAPRVLSLAKLARAANIGLSIDAEEANRLDLSLDVIEEVFSDSALDGWEGFGVVVQAYSKRAYRVLDWLYALAGKINRRMMIRLVKGAYWDTEIKTAQQDGVADFPVFIRKTASDVSFICCAKKLFCMTDRLFPQFATHNAHTMASVLEMAPDRNCFEFQRLHGMGAALHDLVRRKYGTRCRIYAPVGAHRELLAYLVRRLLENGANSSFVNQLYDKEIPPAAMAADPFTVLEGGGRRSRRHSGAIVPPPRLFGPGRKNSKGWDLSSENDLAAFKAVRADFHDHRWRAGPILAEQAEALAPVAVVNPARPDDIVGYVQYASPEDVKNALDFARSWNGERPFQRVAALRKAADLYEQNAGELFAALTREAGKTPADAVAEVREAVDFLRYYAEQTEQANIREARGVFCCISPWNFPLAIFTGQIAAALAAGNGVIAKPAETTTITAWLAVRLLHKAGVPRSVLQLAPGEGERVGAVLVSDPSVDGVCFTGSTATAQRINRSMAACLAPDAPLIAETGGINAMVVDSTALPEQAVRDIIDSAFQSAGQRCSALRVLYVQEDIAQSFVEMLLGAMDELAIGDPWRMETDIGPVISAEAQKSIAGYLDEARREGRVLKELAAPAVGHFVGPAVIEVSGIHDVKREVFGPVLHLATFRADEIDNIVEDINRRGYGLTFGLHTRIDKRIERIGARLKIGNFYVNRNQIGAVVGAQPFGGEGLSGTGPKAGGPYYLSKFQKVPYMRAIPNAAEREAGSADCELVRRRVRRLAESCFSAPLMSEQLPGPTGENNKLSTFARGVILCLGPSAEEARRQAAIARAAGCPALVVAPGAGGPDEIDGRLPRTALEGLEEAVVVALRSDAEDMRAARMALAKRAGPITALATTAELQKACRLERHCCANTTAAGGNASLLAIVGAESVEAADGAAA